MDIIFVVSILLLTLYSTNKMLKTLEQQTDKFLEDSRQQLRELYGDDHPLTRSWK